MATLLNTQITGYIRMPNGTTAQRPTPQEGMLRFNTSTGFEEYYDGSGWVNIAYEEQTVTDGLTAETAAPSAAYIVSNYPNYNSGYYHIKPTGYSGDPIYVYCDLDGSGDVGAGWMRVQYRQDYYSRSSAWGGTANSSTTNPPSSQEFFFDLSDTEVLALTEAASDVRQLFVTYGYGSVGWTYANTGVFQTHIDLKGRWWSRASGGQGSTLTSNRPSGISYNLGISYTSFSNSGSDPTDTNDATWRDGTFTFRDTSGDSILPIKQIRNADVDGATEQRYFPLRNGDDGSGGTPNPPVPSNVWINI